MGNIVTRLSRVQRESYTKPKDRDPNCFTHFTHQSPRSSPNR